MAMHKCAGRKIPNSSGEPICLYESPVSWFGERCPGCGRYLDILTIGAKKIAEKTHRTAASTKDFKFDFIPTGIETLDRVLGGGLVKEKIILFIGEKGSGKSTLAIMTCKSLVERTGRTTLFASAEETMGGVAPICARVGAVDEQINLMAKDEIEDIHSVLDRCREIKPILTIFDSLQRMSVDDMPPGHNRDAAVASIIADYCRASKMCAIIMNHANKKLEAKGSTETGHDIDVEMFLYKYTVEDDGRPSKHFGLSAGSSLNLDNVRTLTVDKNRVGESNLKEFFLMTASGLQALTKKSELEVVS